MRRRLQPSMEYQSSVPPVLPGTARRPARSPAARANALPLLIAVTGAALLGWLVVNDATKVALVGIAAAALGFALRSRPRVGLPLGVVLMATLPAWYRLGSQWLSVPRVAALIALVVVLDRARTRWSVLDTAFAAMLVYAVAEWWLSPPVPHGARILFGQLTPAAFYVAARLWWRGSARTLLWAVLLGAVVGALSIMRESLHGAVIYSDPDSYFWNADETSIFRPGGVFGSPPGAATVLSMAALASLPLVRMSTGRARLLAIVGETVCVVALILTYTRAGLIAFALGGVVYLFLSRSSLLAAGPLLIGALALYLALALALPTVEQSRTFQQGVLRKGNLEARESYWALALPIATRDTRTAIFGIGLNSTLSGRYGGRVQAPLAESPALTLHSTHSQYVVTLLEQGAIGLCLFVAWLLLSLATGLRLRGDPVAAGLTASVVAFAVVASVGNSLWHAPSFAFLALTTGLLAAMSARRGDGSAPAPDVLPQ
jgi:O-antigen ligase